MSRAQSWSTPLSNPPAAGDAEALRTAARALAVAADAIGHQAAAVHRCGAGQRWAGPAADACGARIGDMGRRMGEAGGVLHEASSVMNELAGRLEDATEGAERNVVSAVLEDAGHAFSAARGKLSRMGAHLEALAAHARSSLPPVRVAEHAAHVGLLWSNRVAEKMVAGGLAAGRFLDGRTWEGWLNELPGSSHGVTVFPWVQVRSRPAARPRRRGRQQLMPGFTSPTTMWHIRHRICEAGFLGQKAREEMRIPSG